MSSENSLRPARRYRSFNEMACLANQNAEPEFTRVWMNDEKTAAIGIDVRQWRSFTVPLSTLFPG
jgi:hypothetical protein